MTQFFERFFAFSIIGILVWVVASIVLIVYFAIIYFINLNINYSYYATIAVVSLGGSIYAMKKFVDWEN
jgi:hypothetical protein